MKFVAIICEFNPFHNGHAYLFEEAKRISGADEVLCILSGNFTQRAKPAILHKRDRAKMALLNGAAVVIELPVLFSTAAANRFSEGAISILNSIPAISHLAFGSECGDISLLKKAALIQKDETEEFSAVVKKMLSTGFSYPNALAHATSLAVTNSPNNILGIEYIKALNKLNSKIVPLTIKRSGSHHSNEIGKDFSSSGAIRKAFENGEIEKAAQAMPKSAFELLVKAPPICNTSFNALCINALRETNLFLCPDSGNGGLASAIEKAAKKHTGLCDIIEKAKSKRYTYSRISRVILQALLGITHYEVSTNTNLIGVRKSLKGKILPLLPKNIAIKEKDSILDYCKKISIKANNIYSIITNTIDENLPLLEV